MNKAYREKIIEHFNNLMKIEKRAFELYNDIVEKSTNNEIIIKINEIAKDEENHIKMINEALEILKSRE